MSGCARPSTPTGKLMRMLFAFLFLTSVALGADDKPISEAAFCRDVSRSFDKLRLSGTSAQQLQQFEKWQEQFREEFATVLVTLQCVVEDIVVRDDIVSVKFATRTDQAARKKASLSVSRYLIPLHCSLDRGTQLRKGEKFTLTVKLCFVPWERYPYPHRDSQFQLYRNVSSQPRLLHRGGFVAVTTTGEVSGIPVALEASAVYRKNAEGKLVPFVEWKKEKEGMK